MSMKLYQRSLVAFLKETGLPVYLDGRVPAGAAFPFITLSTAYAPFAQVASVTVTAWFHEDHAHTRCVEMLDALCAAIPEGGTLLHFHGGMAVVHRAGGNFAFLVHDETDRSIIGGRMRLNIHLYDA